MQVNSLASMVQQAYLASRDTSDHPRSHTRRHVIVARQPVVDRFPGCLRRQVNMALTSGGVSPVRARIEGGCSVIELSGNMFNDHEQLAPQRRQNRRQLPGEL